MQLIDPPEEEPADIALVSACDPEQAQRSLQSRRPTVEFNGLAERLPG